MVNAPLFAAEKCSDTARPASTKRKPRKSTETNINREHTQTRTPKCEHTLNKYPCVRPDGRHPTRTHACGANHRIISYAHLDADRRQSFRAPLQEVVAVGEQLLDSEIRVRPASCSACFAQNSLHDFAVQQKNQARHGAMARFNAGEGAMERGVSKQCKAVQERHV